MNNAEMIEYAIKKKCSEYNLEEWCKIWGFTIDEFCGFLELGRKEFKKMKIEINQEDFGALCVCAVRYCQGRQTYMPSLVRGIVREHLGELSDKDLDVMINDCEFQERMDLYGDERIDKPGWLVWKEELLAEREKRGKPIY